MCGCGVLSRWLTNENHVVVRRQRRHRFSDTPQNFHNSTAARLFWNRLLEGFRKRQLQAALAANILLREWILKRLALEFVAALLQTPAQPRPFGSFLRSNGKEGRLVPGSMLVDDQIMMRILCSEAATMCSASLRLLPHGESSNSESSQVGPFCSIERIPSATINAAERKAWLSACLQLPPRQAHSA